MLRPENLIPHAEENSVVAVLQARIARVMNPMGLRGYQDVSQWPVVRSDWAVVEPEMDQRHGVVNADHDQTRAQQHQGQRPDRQVGKGIKVVKSMLREQVEFPLRVMDGVKTPQEIESMPRDMTDIAEKITGQYAH